MRNPGDQTGQLDPLRIRAGLVGSFPINFSFWHKADKFRLRCDVFPKLEQRRRKTDHLPRILGASQGSVKALNSPH